MAFWSGEKLALLLPNLITPFNNSSIDCASYILHLGDQAFVTKDDLLNGDPATVTTQVLSDKPPTHTVCINTGQFAFLLTEESVTVPSHALALINMKTKLKFKGLINVSGFHVDPGFTGKLIFGVYNAGAQSIFLERGQSIAMIVYADLDRHTSKLYDGDATNRKNIGISLVQDMTGQVFSPMMLQRQMLELSSEQRNISTQLAKIETRGQVLDTISLGILAIIVTIMVSVIALDYPREVFGGMLKTAIDQYEGARSEFKPSSAAIQRGDSANKSDPVLDAVTAGTKKGTDRP